MIVPIRTVGGRLAVPAFPLVPTRVGQALPLRHLRHVIGGWVIPALRLDSELFLEVQSAP